MHDRRTLTVSCDDGGASRQALDAVHKDHPARVYGLLDEAACGGEVDEQVGVVHILDTDAEVADTRSRVVGRNGLGTNGHNVRYASVRERPGRDGSIDPGGQKQRNSIREGLSEDAVPVPNTPTCPNRVCPL